MIDEAFVYRRIYPFKVEGLFLRFSVGEDVFEYLMQPRDLLWIGSENVIVEPVTSMVGKVADEQVEVLVKRSLRGLVESYLHIRLENTWPVKLHYAELRQLIEVSLPHSSKSRQAPIASPKSSSHQTSLVHVRKPSVHNLG